MGDAARRCGAQRRDVSWPPGIGYVRTPHAPYSAGADLLHPHLCRRRRRRTPAYQIHVAGTGPLRCCATAPVSQPAPCWGAGRRSPIPRPGRCAGGYLASLGALEPSAPPLFVRLCRHPARSPHRAPRWRDDRALSALEPPHRRPPSRRERDPRGWPPRRPRHRQPRLDAGSFAVGWMATLSAHFPAIPAASWITAATAGGAAALGHSAYGAIAPGKRPGLLDVLVDDATRPLESLVRDPLPSLRWVARAG